MPDETPAFAKRPLKWYRLLVYTLLLASLGVIFAGVRTLSDALPFARGPMTTIGPLFFDNSSSQLLLQSTSRPNEQKTVEYDLSSRTTRVVHANVSGIMLGRSETPFRITRANIRKKLQESNPGFLGPGIDESKWKFTQFDRDGNSERNAVISFGSAIEPRPVQAVLPLLHFALSMDGKGIYVVDLATETLQERFFDFPSQLAAINVMQQLYRVGKSRFARLISYSNGTLVELFELNDDGTIVRIATWPITTRSVVKTVSGSYIPPSLNLLDSRIYTLSETGDSIEVRSTLGEYQSEIKPAGIDLKKAAWRWNGSLIQTELKEGGFVFHLLETGAQIDLPPSMVGEPSVIGRDENHLVLNGLSDFVTGQEYVGIVDQQSGKFRRLLAKKPLHSYLTSFENGELKLVVVSSEYGLSISKQKLLEDFELETHYPFRQWMPLLFLVVFAFIAWTLAWLFLSARMGGKLSVDIAMLGFLLMGVLSWRLLQVGNPYDYTRLPYQYLSGVLQGWLAVSVLFCFRNNRNWFGLLTPWMLTFVFAIWWFKFILFARPVVATVRESPVRVTTFPEGSTFALALVLIALAVAVLASGMLMFSLRWLGIRLERPRESINAALLVGSRQLSVRNFLLLIALIALLVPPFRYNGVDRAYWRLMPWFATIASTLLAVALSISFAILGVYRGRWNVRIGWVLTLLVMLILLLDFCVDFISGKLPPIGPEWLLVRAILTGAVVSFLFAFRVRLGGYRLGRLSSALHSPESLSFVRFLFWRPFQTPRRFGGDG